MGYVSCDQSVRPTLCQESSAQSVAINNRYGVLKFIVIFLFFRP